LSGHRGSVRVDSTIILVFLVLAFAFFSVLSILFLLTFLTIERFRSGFQVEFRSSSSGGSSFGLVGTSGKESEGVDGSRWSSSFGLGLLLVGESTSRSEGDGGRISVLSNSSESAEISSLRRSLRLCCPSISTRLGNTEVTTLSSSRVWSRELIAKSRKLAS